MELKFVRYQHFILWKGFIGTILCIIGLAINSNVACNNEIENNQTNEKTDNTTINNTTFQLFGCQSFYGGKNYYDNFISYFIDLSNDNQTGNYLSENKTKSNNYNVKEKITIEVFMLFFYFVFHFISELSLILVNKFLTPLHYLIAESIYNLLHLPFELLAIYLYYKGQSDEEDDIIAKTETSRILKLFAAVAEFLGYLIYMEVIHLNFCGLNKNIKKNIEERAKLDAILDIDPNESYNINDCMSEDNDDGN